MTLPARSAPGPALPRPLGVVNWAGLWTHGRRGLQVYFHYAISTIGGPAVSGLLFLAIFSITLGDLVEPGSGASFIHFVVPGIGMVFLTHQAFQQAAFLILDDKLEGMIADFLMAPLSPLELMLGYALHAAVTGLVTGGVLLAIMALLTGLPLAAPWAVLGYAALGALLFAGIGTLAGLWAERWEHYSAAETFLILPLGILSGAFFSLESLPEATRWLIALNPAFYVIEGFRSGFIGGAAPAVGIPLLLCLIVALWACNWRLFAVGYKLKP
ncbi:MAG: ABC transporter permease [Kiloniellales bacterium]